MLKVVKVGGSVLEDESWVRRFAEAAAAADDGIVVVHGGGPEISALAGRLGVAVSWHNGRRVTTPDALDVASMVLSGRINKRLVAALVNAGRDAVGLSGQDGALVQADLVDGGALGCVGQVAEVRATLLDALLALGIVPVVSPISRGPGGAALNVNADEVATAIAAALEADELLFLTDVDGVRSGGRTLDVLSAADAQTLIHTGVAAGGMSVKVAAGIAALASRVAVVRIGGLDMLTEPMAGTRISAAAQELMA